MLGPGECKPLPVQQSGDNRTPRPPLAHYASVAHVARVYDYLLMAQQTTLRNRAQVGRFFEGLNLVEPGLVRVPEWRPAMAIDARAPAQMWAGVALKP